MNKPTKPVGTSDKHIVAGQGETPLQDALVKARMFAVKERAMLDSKRGQQTNQTKKSVQ